MVQTCFLQFTRYFVARKVRFAYVRYAHARTYHRNSNELLNVLATTFILKNIIGWECYSTQNISPPLKCVGGGSVFWVVVFISPKTPLKFKNVGGGVGLVWVKRCFLILWGILCVYECISLFFFFKCEKIER